MIVKKIAVSKAFPKIDTLRELTFPERKNEGFYPVFYDIETTGLARYTSSLYLIGAVKYEGQSWQLYQWLGENKEEEPALLKAFSAFLEDCSCTIQYNGDRFDQPYLEARYAANGLPNPFTDLPSLDLYKKLKPLAPLFKLSHMKQPDLEAFLGRPARTYCNGKKCVSLCQSFWRQNSPQDGEILLGHNREDLLRLGEVTGLLGYLCLYNGSYKLKSFTLEEETVFVILSLPFLLPQVISNGCEEFYLTAKGQEARLSIRQKDGRLRMYYENYKDYDYLPGEDTAISKSLSQFIDRSLVVPAKPDTCYTWFTCGESFLSSPSRQLAYIRRALPHLLNRLKS